jgi:hypothetical protein
MYLRKRQKIARDKSLAQGTRRGEGTLKTKEAKTL